MTPATGKKGIRDALEHKPVELAIVVYRSTGTRLTVKMVSNDSQVDNRRDILDFIPQAVAGLSRLMTAILASIGDKGHYELLDTFGIFGVDDDIAGYWPRIGG